MNKIIELHVWQVAAAFIFIVILMLIVKIKELSREKEILISSLRMTLQLTFTGYFLTYLFNSKNPLYTILVLAVMETFAVKNVFKRVRIPLSPKLRKIIALSMVLGTISSLAYFILVVINLSPWYESRYVIPIGGMIIGNAMTGLSLGTLKLVEGFISKRQLIESSLMLGATPKMASKEIVDGAFDSAILPTINSMVGMGIVSLPGMMTGQILSGTSPLIAIRYQIAIMLGIAGSVSLTVILFVQTGYKTFFNDEKQLVIDDD